MANNNSIYDVIIIGGGPAGLFAAINSADKNNKILILEKNKICGKKLLLSGSGQCNLTNAADINTFLDKYGDKGRFLKHSLLTFTNLDLINYFKARGLDFIVNEDKKVFPKSLKSSDILKILINNCLENNIEIKYEISINKVIYEDFLFKIICTNETFYSKYLVLSCGGKSYPQTGSDGSGYIYAKQLGHKITDLSPSLTPVYIKNFDLADLAGISFENLNISLWREKKKISSYTGDLLITHKGLSGPVILDNSRDMKKNDIIKIHFININEYDFKNDFILILNSNGKQLIKNLLKKYHIPSNLIKKILEKSNIDENILASQLTKNDRNFLLQNLLNYELIIEDLGGFDIAMATHGGISTDEINSKTMESKIINNLYFCGEIIDYDGNTGGYNLQAAFSTGYIAGTNIKKKINSNS